MPDYVFDADKPERITYKNTNQLKTKKSEKCILMGNP